MDKRRVIGWCLNAGSLVASTVVSMVWSDIGLGVGLPILIACAVVVLIGLSLVLVPDQLWAKWFSQTAAATNTEHGSAPANINIASHNQSGGITAHTVNVHSPPQRTMGPELKAGLLQALPKVKPMRVLGRAGDTESMNFAREVHGFLQANGFTMATPHAYEHQFFEVPPVNVNINLHAQHDTEVWLTIGAAR